MRSVSVVLPASTCAMTPMFLSLFFIANPLEAPDGTPLTALQAMAGPPSCIRYVGSAAFLACAQGTSRAITSHHGGAKARAQASRALANGNRGNQLVIGTHVQAPRTKNPGRASQPGSCPEGRR